MVLLILIGMLHHRKDPSVVTKSYAIAAAAKAEGADLVFFSPKAVDIDNKTINGYMYINGNWLKTQTRLPDVIYNAGSPVKLNKSKNIIDKLKETIPFTTYSIGNKMNVFKRLCEKGEFSRYVIPSEPVYSLRTFLDRLDKYNKIVFKPINGHKGEGVIYIEPIRENYCVHEGTNSTYMDRKQLRSFVREKISIEKYMIQPFINCKSKSGNAFDIRAHVQKDGEGNWVITSIYPRIAPYGSIIANINSGGYTNYLVPFLKQEYGKRYFDIKRYLEVFSLQFSQHMEQIQNEYFNESIDELGIDIGLDDMGRIWIFEVNWRPGAPPAFYLELNVLRNMIRYAMHLASGECHDT